MLDRRGGPDSCHLVLFASEPVIGVEDRARRNQRPYWDLAIQMAERIRRPGLGERDWLVGINPMTARTQHQLHLHAGWITPVMRQALERAGRNSQFQTMKISVRPDPAASPRAHLFRVRWIADSDPAANAQLSQRSPFALVSLDAGEEAMPRAAILLSRGAGGPGYHLLYTLDGQAAEDLIDFSGPCELQATDLDRQGRSKQGSQWRAGTEPEQTPLGPRSLSRVDPRAARRSHP